MLSDRSHERNVLLLIIFSSALRLIVASVTELGNDAVYYWTYAQHLQWNYFDHPPMVALWIRIFTANLGLQDHEVFIRLGSIISCAVSTWLIYLTVKKLDSARAGWIAACLYNASIYAGIIAGLFILPDSPQMVFWCLSLYLLVQMVNNENKWLYWIAFGACTG